jgi:tRNA-Thr(GGU) m(6)t(6)A37 methyltransferase TsaA
MVEPGRAATAKGAVSVDVVLSSAAAATKAKKAHTAAQPRQSATPNAMGDLDSNSLRLIGVVRSPLEDREEAPNQGSEGAPEAWIELTPSVLDGLDGIEVGDELIVITWLHEARRDVLKTYPRGDTSVPLAGVFATRSPDRPNPLGLHPVVVLEIADHRLRVGPLEAIDGTPVVDIKPVI